MITFDGVALESLANVKIEDVRVNPIQYDDVTRVRATSPGSVFVRSRAGNRTVVITFAIPDDDKTHRQASLLAVSQWAKTDREHKLELPGHPDHYLMAVCTAKPEPSLRMWWEAKLRLTFTCFDNPFWNDLSEKSVACGTAFNVLGDAPPLMRIERTVSAAVTDQSYSLDGLTMTFSTIPAGNVVIDLNRQTAVIGNESLMPYYNINSRFLLPRCGSQTITGTGTVKYRERWE